MTNFDELKKAFSPFSCIYERQYKILPEGNLKQDVDKAVQVQDPNIITHWYDLQKSIINACIADGKTNLNSKIIQYLATDSQFPPDIVKCHRLSQALSAFKPSSIVELGCGTSSLVINEYCKTNSIKTSALTIDNDKNWIDITCKKLKRFNSHNTCDHKFWHCKDDKETIDRLSTYLNSTERCFIFLDAKVIQEDSSQGMDLIINICNSLPKKTAIMIDSRKKAVLALQKLSTVSGRTIELLSSIYSPTIPSRDSDKRRDFELAAYAVLALKTQSMQSIAYIDETLNET